MSSLRFYRVKRYNALAKEQKAIGIITCFVSDVLWGANEEFSYIIKQLKSTFKIVAEHKEMLEYVRVHL